jgi:6-phosphogluconate dehydrogenase
LENALAFSFVIAYAQGLSMLAKASEELKMEIPLPAVIQVWKAGCIIRSSLLGNFTKAFEKNSNLSSLLLDNEIAELLKNREGSLRKIISSAVISKISLPGIMSVLAYYDNFSNERMPTNLIQAQRDYFGAHTYQRIDKPGVFHTEWHEQI